MEKLRQSDGFIDIPTPGPPPGEMGILSAPTGLEDEYLIFDIEFLQDDELYLNLATSTVAWWQDFELAEQLQGGFLLGFVLFGIGVVMAVMRTAGKH